MGFGDFLKKAINPLTPFKMVAGATKQTLQGNPMGALKASVGMNPGGKQPRQQAGPYGGIMGGQPGQPGGIGGMLANQFKQPQMKQAGMLDAQPQPYGQGGTMPQFFQQQYGLPAQQAPQQPQYVAPGADYAQRGGVAPQGQMPQQQAPQQQPEMDYEALKAQYGVQRAREMMAGQ